MYVYFILVAAASIAATRHAGRQPLLPLLGSRAGSGTAAQTTAAMPQSNNWVGSMAATAAAATPLWQQRSLAAAGPCGSGMGASGPGGSLSAGSAGGSAARLLLSQRQQHRSVSDKG